MFVLIGVFLLGFGYEIVFDLSVIVMWFNGWKKGGILGFYKCIYMYLLVKYYLYR